MTDITTVSNGGDQHMLRMQAAFASYADTSRERDELRKQVEELTLEVQRLEIAQEQAVERERMHVQKIIDETMITNKRYETEISMLRDELTLARSREMQALAQTAEAHARCMRLLARVDLVRAALGQTLDEDKNDEKLPAAATASNNASNGRDRSRASE